MLLPTSERPTCSEDVEKKQGDGTWVQKAKRVARQGLKWLISSVLLRPATWRFLLVQFPDVWDRAALVGKQVLAWVADLF